MTAIVVLLQVAFLARPAAAQQVIFVEHCDSANFTSRGWYDNNRLTVTTAEHIPGSTASLEFRFLKGATTPTSGGGIRRLFPASDSVYLSCWVKYSANWEGSNKPYHPHEFHFITDVDDRYIGPAATHLTTYIEQNEGRPMLSIQDALNIDAARIDQDLTLITERRAVSGCNGSSDRYPAGDCYRAGTDYRNGKSWKASRVCFTDTSGAYFKNDWHFIEAFFKLNTISAGKGVADGVVRYWFDGTPMIDAPDVMLRTAEHAGMRFNQFLIAPYIGDGSPVEQTMWIDEITVADSRPAPTAAPVLPYGIAIILEPNAPNPFAGSTVTRYSLHAPAHVRLEVLDILGRRISMAVDGWIDSGTHACVFDMANTGTTIPSGVLLCRLTTSTHSVTRCMMALR